jgi:hypothetical protein
MIYGAEPEDGPPPQEEQHENSQTEEKIAENTPVNEQFKNEQKTLLDTLGEEKKETLAEKHQHAASDGIKKNITLNQRFMFLNELFQGNMDEFEMVINALENCQSKQEALDFIRVNYFDKNVWEKDKEEVTEFLDIIHRRFPQ